MILPNSSDSSDRIGQQKRPFLTVNRASYIFDDGPLHVLSDISLTITTGAFVALLGPSGVGKSTLLRILAGILQPSTGQIHMSHHSSNGEGETIGVVFQRDNLMPWRTVAENVRLPLELRGINGSQAKDRVQEMLDLVGLSGLDLSYPAQLSGGMAQRVAIARALVHRPALLLLDEPFGSLDALTRERMGQELLRIWQANPVTVFMVTHSIHEAVLLADEVLMMGGNPSGGSPATITHRVPINLPRPRSIDVQRTSEFQDYTMTIRDAIQIPGESIRRTAHG
jgi:NitT/TauT family transport system ATP-binding protein